MSREFKFRAWDKKRELIFNIECIDFKNGLVIYKGAPIPTFEEMEAKKIPAIEPYYQSFDALILLQYTGLKDKNGKEIYEGDIVRFGVGEKLDEILIGDVYYETPEFRIRHPEGYHGQFSLTSKYVPFCNFEVIGNIFENPELIETAK